LQPPIPPCKAETRLASCVWVKPVDPPQIIFLHDMLLTKEGFAVGNPLLYATMESAVSAPDKE
jgi:hypothetical protein